MLGKRSRVHHKGTISMWLGNKWLFAVDHTCCVVEPFALVKRSVANYCTSFSVPIIGLTRAGVECQSCEPLTKRSITMQMVFRGFDDATATEETRTPFAGSLHIWFPYSPHYPHATVRPFQNKITTAPAFYVGVSSLRLHCLAHMRLGRPESPTSSTVMLDFRIGFSLEAFVGRATDAIARKKVDWIWNEGLMENH